MVNNSKTSFLLVSGMVIGYLNMKDKDYGYVELSFLAVTTFLLLWLILYLVDLVIDGYKARRDS